MASPMESQRNVVIVGKTGCGKSTIGNQLLGYNDDDEANDAGARDKPFKVVSSPSGGTLEPDMRKGGFEYEGVQYHLTVIDTVGLFDIAHLSNKEVMKKTKTAIRKYVDCVHLIIFVMKDGRYTEEERKTFDIVHRHFSVVIDPLSLLVITGCESKKNREDVVSAYKDNDYTGKVTRHMGKEVVTVGFPSLKDCDEELRPYFRKIAEKDRRELHKIVAASNKSFLKDELYSRSWCPIL